ncbi:hypothetical protein EYV94_28460 [Puteibacter caeruleilacunae]|nr:hypothetical protein EYV94_28460 [Puteibacter caeruleilacunae]
MKKLGKLNLKDLEKNMLIIEDKEKVLIKGGDGLINLRSSEQEIGMGLLNALKTYYSNNKAYDRLDDIIDFSTGNINGTTFNTKSGTFKYNGETYYWSIVKPYYPDQGWNINGYADQGFSLSDNTGRHGIEVDTGQTFILIRSVGRDDYKAIDNYIEGSIVY